MKSKARKKFKPRGMVNSSGGLKSYSQGRKDMFGQCPPAGPSPRAPRKWEKRKKHGSTEPSQWVPATQINL